MFSFMHGSVHMGRYEAVDGVLVPREMSVYLGGPDEDPDDYIHRMVVTDFRFDSFDAAVLYPDAKLAKVGNAKL